MSSARDKLIETMARAMIRLGRHDAMEAAMLALTALESSGMVVVPADEREAWASDVGALLGAIEVMEDGSEMAADHRLRHLDIATRFGQWAVAKAASPTQRDASSDRPEGTDCNE